MNPTRQPAQNVTPLGRAPPPATSFRAASCTRPKSVEADLVEGSVNLTDSNPGRFQLKNNRLLGYRLGAPLPVQTGKRTLPFDLHRLSGIESGGMPERGGRRLDAEGRRNPAALARPVVVLPYVRSRRAALAGGRQTAAGRVSHPDSEERGTVVGRIIDRP
ncbi:MAG TPA: hypothetical protein VE083_10170 [Terriglobales bacterium]|nr:hypothetical protein [Terriglobales bacterium]